MITPIVKEPDPRLHRKAMPVREVSEEVQRIIDTMIETMIAAQGVGLAANQIGSPLDILVASTDGKRGKEIILLNAVIEERWGREISSEGCLSVPGVSADLPRAAQVTASGLDRLGSRITVKAEGLLAKILQHETDHLQGHLFLDRLGRWHRRRLLKEYKRLSATLRQVRL